MIGTTNTGGRPRLMRRYATLTALTLGIIAAPTVVRAQSAIIYRSVSNFDIANETGKICHGFEIDRDGTTVDCSERR